MLMFLVVHGNTYLKNGYDKQHSEWTKNIHEAYHFDQHAVHQAFELAELYDGAVYGRDMDTGAVALV